MSSGRRREPKLRNNTKVWKEEDATWILGRYDFEEEPGTGSSHRVFLNPKTGVKATWFVHGAKLLPYVAQDILDQIDKSEEIRREAESGAP